MRDEYVDPETRDTLAAAVKASRDATRKGAPVYPADLVGKNPADLCPRDYYRGAKALGLDVPDWHIIDAEQGRWEAAQAEKAKKGGAS